MKNILLVKLFITLVIFSNSCATNYSCGQFPESGCQPVSQVYDKTNDGFHDYRKKFYNNSKSTSSQRGNLDVIIAPTNKVIASASPGDPILTKPVVLRVLFSSWQDLEKDLNGGGYIYVRLRDSEWVTEK